MEREREERVSKKEKRTPQARKDQHGTQRGYGHSLIVLAVKPTIPLGNYDNCCGDVELQLDNQLLWMWSYS